MHRLLVGALVVVLAGCTSADPNLSNTTADRTPDATSAIPTTETPSPEPTAPQDPPPEFEIVGHEDFARVTIVDALSWWLDSDGIIEATAVEVGTC